MNKCFKLIHSVLLVSLLALANSTYAEVSELTASVDKNSILSDESIRLTVVASGSTDKDAIDFSALLTDFSASQPSFSQSTQIINGDMTRTVSWSINLYPKQTGTFTIPSFEIDGVSTQSFSVNVLPVSASSSNQPREFFVTSELDTQSIFLQQQILYTVKIHLSRDIERGQLTLPVLEGAVIEQIGEDEDYQEIINGVRYRIIERKYAIIPQASGNFLIKGPIFEAEVLTNSRRSFANFGRTKRITRRAPDIDINVKPIPQDYSFTWLPSELVEISEEWQGDENNLVAGEPITRTITLTALGLTKEQLPNIDLPYHPSFKVYPEQPNLSTVELNENLIAQGVYNSAIIPSESGSFVLPELRIPWFNVRTGNTEFAFIPARTVNVAPAVVSNTSNTNSPNQPVENTNEPLVGSNDITTNIDSNNTYWIYVLLSTNLLTIVALYVMWLSRNKSISVSNASSDYQQPILASEAQLFKVLKDNLEQGKQTSLTNDLDAWLTALLGNQHYSVSSSLSRYANTKALQLYNQALSSQYANSNINIDFRGLIDAVSIIRKEAQASYKGSVLNQLYPET